MTIKRPNRKKRYSGREHEVITRVRHEPTPKRDNRVHPAVRLRVFTRDGGCVARQVDPSHACEGELTAEHVPIFGQNALGKKVDSTEEHLISLCRGANSGGTVPWGEMHRDLERAWLARWYPA